MKFPIVLSHTLKRLAAPLVVALAVMFAIGPVADGLVCGADEPSVALVPVQGEELPAKPDVDGHAVCSHGHCHHGSLVIPDSTGADPEPLLMAEAPSLTASASAPSAHLSNLERPPRA